MLLFETPLTYLRLHVCHKIVFGFHQSGIYFAREISYEIGVKLCHFLSDDCIDSGLVSGFEIV